MAVDLEVSPSYAATFPAYNSAKLGEIMVPSNVAPWDEVRTRLNNLLRGWATYFSYGMRIPTKAATYSNLIAATIPT